MTRAGWFKLISIFIIIAMLFAICFIEGHLVNTSLKQVNQYCYQIEQAAEKNDGIVNGEVASLVDNLEDYWYKHEIWLCFMVNHKSLEPLGVEIVRLKTYINEEEPIEFFVSLDLIQYYVEQFQHFMGANINNVL